MGYSTAPTWLNVTGARHLPFRFASFTPENVLLEEDVNGETFIPVLVVNAIGEPATGVTATLTEEGEAGTVYWGEWFGGATSAVSMESDFEGVLYLLWYVPRTPGTYRITLSSPLVAEPLQLTAVRAE